jgi:hypothetical protein
MPAPKLICAPHSCADHPSAQPSTTVPVGSDPPSAILAVSPQGVPRMPCPLAAASAAGLLITGSSPTGPGASTTPCARPFPKCRVERTATARPIPLITPNICQTTFRERFRGGRRAVPRPEPSARIWPTPTARQSTKGRSFSGGRLRNPEILTDVDRQLGHASGGSCADHCRWLTWSEQRRGACSRCVPVDPEREPEYWASHWRRFTAR